MFYFIICKKYFIWVFLLVAIAHFSIVMMSAMVQVIISAGAPSLPPYDRDGSRRYSVQFPWLSS